MRGSIIVISAPSGTGKTTICRRFLSMHPNLRFSVSFTTREPRPGEKDGVDYYFISERSFRERIEQGEFVEWVENYGRYYGTSKKKVEECLENGCDLLIDVEPRGAGRIKENYPEGVFVFILPPSMGELKRRLTGRGFEGENEVARRLNNAHREIREVFWYDYVIFNQNLDEAVDQLHAIYTARKVTREAQMQGIGGFLEGAEREQVTADW